MADLEDPNAELWFGVSVDEIDTVIHLDFVRAADGKKSRITAGREQAYWIAEKLIGAIATLDARNAERCDLDKLFSLQSESPRHERNDRP